MANLLNMPNLSTKDMEIKTKNGIQAHSTIMIMKIEIGGIG